MTRHESLTKAKLELRLPVSEAEIKALDRFRRVHLKAGTQHDIERMATMLLRIALMHPKDTSEKICRLVRYCRAEELNQDRHCIGIIAAHRSYRGRKAVIA